MLAEPKKWRASFVGVPLGWHFLRKKWTFLDFFLIFLDFFEMNSGSVNGMTMSLEG